MDWLSLGLSILFALSMSVGLMVRIQLDQQTTVWQVTKETLRKEFGFVFSRRINEELGLELEEIFSPERDRIFDEVSELIDSNNLDPKVTALMINAVEELAKLRDVAVKHHMSRSFLRMLMLFFIIALLVTFVLQLWVN